MARRLEVPSRDELQDRQRLLLEVKPLASKWSRMTSNDVPLRCNSSKSLSKF